MAAKDYKPLLRAYTQGTAVGDRTYLEAAFQHLWEIDEHKADSRYVKLFDSFLKQRSTDLKQPLLVTKPGVAPVYYATPLVQGHNYAPKYHPQAKNQNWTVFNPVTIKYKSSRTDDDRPEFMTEEQIKIAIRAEAFAAANAINYWKEMIVQFLFITPTDWKALGASGDNKGLNAEFHDLYFPTDGNTKGLPMRQQDLSLQQLFKYFKDDGTIVEATDSTNISSAKSYMVKVDDFMDSIKLIQKMIAANKVTAEKSEHAFFKEQGSEDYQKWLGLLKKTKQVVLEMTSFRTTAYNVGCKSDGTGCTDCKDECTKLMKKGINVGVCQTCLDDDKNCCCCYNQIMAKKEDLKAYMNPKDKIEIQEAYPYLNNVQSLNSLADDLGVSEVVYLPTIKSGDIIIMNTKTIGIHPIRSEVGTAVYPEDNLHNTWVKLSFHFGLWPYQCVTISKAT